MKKLHQTTLLIDFYGKLLTEKKLYYLQQYYFNDFSLSEIAELNNVSKNAIYDSIKSALLELENYEKKLKLIQKRNLRFNLYNLINDPVIKKKLIDLDRM